MYIPYCNKIFLLVGMLLVVMWLLQLKQKQFIISLASMIRDFMDTQVCTKLNIPTIKIRGPYLS